MSCSECGAGFRRLELTSLPPTHGEFRCLACGIVLETFDGNTFVAYRLTIQPIKRYGAEDRYDEPLGFLVSDASRE